MAARDKSEIFAVNQGLDVPTHANRRANALYRAMPTAQLISEVMGFDQDTTGLMLDVGAGGAWMDIALAQITKLDFVIQDINPYRFDPADVNIAEFCLGDRMTINQSDVHDLPFEDNTFDYAITSGSIGFWHNPQRGIEEVIRVLKPGGRFWLRGFEGDRWRCIWDILKDVEGLYDFSINRRGNESWCDLWKPGEDDAPLRRVPGRTPCCDASRV